MLTVNVTTVDGKYRSSKSSEQCKMLRYALFSLLVLGHFHRGNGEDFCKSSTEIQVIDSFLQENTSMLCIISKECTNVWWEQHPDTGSAFRMTSGTRKFDESEFSVDTNLTLAQTILNVTNVSKNLAGTYSCHCMKKIKNSTLQTSSTEGCFNLSANTLKCQMQAEIRRKRKVSELATKLHRHFYSYCNYSGLLVLLFSLRCLSFVYTKLF